MNIWQSIWNWIVAIFSHKPEPVPAPKPTPEPTPTPVPVPPPAPKPVTPPRPSDANNLQVSAGANTVPGIDVSAYDPGTDWLKVAASGIKFAFIKATEGTSWTNQYFASDWVNAKQAGVLRGAYHFFHPGDDPVAQANLFLSTVGALGAQDLPMVIDWEATDNIISDTDNTNALTFLQLVQKGSGKVPIIYTGVYFYNALGNPQEFYPYPLWIAAYDISAPFIPAPWNTWTFWQYTDSGNVNGMENPADMSYFNGTITQLQQFIANSVV